jgi:hypothetical protein
MTHKDRQMPGLTQAYSSPSLPTEVSKAGAVTVPTAIPHLRLRRNHTQHATLGNSRIPVACAVGFRLIDPASKWHIRNGSNTGDPKRTLTRFRNREPYRQLSPRDSC